jgi:hypothetical protein
VGGARPNALEHPGSPTIQRRSLHATRPRPGTPAALGRCSSPSRGVVTSPAKRNGPINEITLPTPKRKLRREGQERALSESAPATAWTCYGTFSGRQVGSKGAVPTQLLTYFAAALRLILYVQFSLIITRNLTDYGNRPVPVETQETTTTRRFPFVRQGSDYDRS